MTKTSTFLLSLRRLIRTSSSRTHSYPNRFSNQQTDILQEQQVTTASKDALHTRPPPRRRRSRRHPNHHNVSGHHQRQRHRLLWLRHISRCVGPPQWLVTESVRADDALPSIINNCLGTENAQLAACQANDWDCLCTQTTNVLTCYNNCPTDPNAFGVQQQQTSYCNAAKAYAYPSRLPSSPA